MAGIHYSDVIMGAMASLITRFTSVYSTVYSGAHQREHQSFASLAFVRGIHRGPVNFPYKWPVTRKCFHLLTSSCLASSNSFSWTEICSQWSSSVKVNNMPELV